VSKVVVQWWSFSFEQANRLGYPVDKIVNCMQILTLFVMPKNPAISKTKRPIRPVNPLIATE
jgi:hypothetical protein